jgi:arylformamidase
MNLHDITVPISSSMPVWPGDPPVRLEQVKSIMSGDSCNVTFLSMGAHTGTHIDAPCHYLERGMTVDAIPLEQLNGPCRVVETSARDNIERSHLEHHDLAGCSRILIKTRNSGLWNNSIHAFEKDFTALGLSAAQYLVDSGVVLVGIDYLSIEAFRPDDGNPVHTTLLGNNIIILEGLNLSAVSAGEYDLVCLPLKLAGADGAPARVMLRET